MVWKQFQRSCRYPKIPCTSCPVSLTACAAPNPSQGRRGRGGGAEGRSRDFWSHWLLTGGYSSQQHKMQHCCRLWGQKFILFALRSPGQHQASRCTSSVLSMWWGIREAARRLCCSTSSENSNDSNSGLETSAATVRLPVPLTQVLRGDSFYSVFVFIHRVVKLQSCWIACSYISCSQKYMHYLKNQGHASLRSSVATKRASLWWNNWHNSMQNLKSLTLPPYY